MSPTAEKTAASWARRQAHEHLVHRMDLEAAAGVPHAPVDTALADDGVDELLTVILPRWAHTEPLTSADAATVGHLHRHRPHLVGARRTRAPSPCTPMPPAPRMRT